MPRPRPFSSYTSVFEDALYAAAERGEFRIECGSEDRAKGLRSQFYSYRRALRNAALRSNLGAGKTLIVAADLSFSVEDSTLVIRNGGVYDPLIQSALEAS